MRRPTFRAELDMLLGVDVKPSSGIESWGGWPDDVRSLLEAWNSGPEERLDKLSFYRRGLFDCWDCKARCEPAACGAAYFNKHWLCDDCLITRARRAIAFRAQLRETWRGGGTMRRRT